MATDTLSFIPFSAPLNQPIQISTSSATPSSTVTGTNQTVVSCVFCIDASLKSRLNWKPYGAQYTLSYTRALQLLHPTATLRLLPVFFTSLPPSLSPSQSITRPYPFLELEQFKAIIPELLPLKPTNSQHSPTLDASCDYGGEDPAILDAIICAMELLDRKPTSSYPHPRARNRTKTQDPIHHKHILIITSSDIGSPAMPVNLNTSEDLPKILPLLNQSAEYDGVTLQDLAGRFLKDNQGRWNINDKQIGLLERKSILLGLISVTRTPFLLNFIGRHLGPQKFHLIRQQNLIRSLHPSHCVVIGGFTDLITPSNKRPAPMLSNNNTSIPFSPNSHLAASRIVSHKAVHDGSFQPSNKRPRTESGHDHPPAVSSSNPFSITGSNALHPSMTRTSLTPAPNNGHPPIAFPVVIPPQEQSTQSREPQHLPQFLSPSHQPSLASTQPDHQASNMPDNSLAQGLSLLIGGNKSSPASQTTLGPANHSNSSLGPVFGSTRSQSTPGVSSVEPNPPTDALSQALALLTGPQPVGRPAQPFPLTNLPPPSHGSQPHSTSPQKQTQPSPLDHQAAQYTSTIPNPTQQVFQTGAQQTQQIFQPQQIQQKQQQQIQQLQQLQETHKIQVQHAASQRPQTSSGMASQSTPSLLPAASIISSQQQSQPQQMNPNGSGRSIAPWMRALMESAQTNAREQLNLIEAKLQRGELGRAEALEAKEKVKKTVTDLLRGYATNAKAAAQGNESILPPPNLAPPPMTSDAPLLWTGRMVFTIPIPGTGINGTAIQYREVMLPVGAVPCYGQAGNEWLRMAAESWPKIWRLDPLRPTTMPELSNRTQLEKPGGVALHLLNEPAIVSNGGISNEDLYTKLCERLGLIMTTVVPFDEMGHGAVILYNRGLRMLFGLVFQRTTIPYQLFLPPPSSTSITRPNSTGASSRPTGSPGMMNTLSSNNNLNHNSSNNQINPALQAAGLPPAAQKQLVQQMLAQQQHRNQQLFAQQQQQHHLQQQQQHHQHQQLSQQQHQHHQHQQQQQHQQYQHQQLNQQHQQSHHPHPQQLLHNLSAPFPPTNLQPPPSSNPNSNNSMGHTPSW